MTEHSRYTSACIGCKACEVACKEWNLVPDDGFERLGILHAGIQSTQDPKYVVERQRRRVAERGPTRVD